MKSTIVAFILINQFLNSYCGKFNMKKIENCYTNNITMIVEQCWVRELTVTLVDRIIVTIDKIDVN